MVSETDMMGGYQSNLFHFQNFWANYLCLEATGEQIPRQAYQPNFVNPDKITSYSGVHEALRFDIRPDSWDLTPEEGANG